MNFDRQPSTTIKAPKNAAACPKIGVDKAAWKAMFDDARAAFGANLQGLTSVKGGRAWFQITGDSTPYSVMLTETELAMFFI